MWDLNRTIALVLAVCGYALAYWAKRSLPPGTNMRPVPIVQRTMAGPYRWLAHPMYLGNTFFIAGMIAAGGPFAFLGAAELAGFIFRDWVYRETGPRTGAPSVL